ncbi:MAG: hypothetical protein AAB074_00360 [Planctomycetota bacterium]
MTADTPEDKGSVAEARPSPPPVPPSPAPGNPAPEAPAPRFDLETALAEVERLSLDAKQHAATKSTAERQAADLSTLRKFHEKAHSEIERLKNDKAILAAEKENMLKQVAEAVTDRRRREQAEADAERMKHETRRYEGEKLSLEKKVAESDALRASLEKATAEVERLKRRVGELEAAGPGAKDGAGEHSGELFPQPPTPRLPFKAALPETQVMPPYLPETSRAPDFVPEPPPAAPPPPVRKSNPPATAKSGTHASGASEVPGRIRYSCVGCSRKLGAPADFAGTYGTCKFCGHRMKVPLASTR